MRLARALVAGPLLVAALLFTYATGTPTVLLLALVGLPLGVWLGPHVELGWIAQSLALGVVVVLGALLGDGLLADATGIGPGALARVWAIVGMIAILACLTRRFFDRPMGGEKLDFALLCLAMAACGQRRAGLVYVVASVAFVAAGLVLLRARPHAPEAERERDEGSAWRVVEMHGLPTLAAMIGLGAVLVTVSTMGLPRLQDLLQPRLSSVIFAVKISKTGFTDRLHLGSSPNPILESDEMVMRVYGPRVDYLRGQVFDHYEGGTWTWSKEVQTPIATGVGRPPGNVTEIRAVGDPSGRDKRTHYFLPLGAHAIATAHGSAVADSTGTLRPVGEEPATPVYFVHGTPDMPIRGPTEEDTRVPDNLRPVLAALASEWTAGTEGARPKLLSLEKNLRTGFSYSLEPNVPEPGEQRLVHFLVHSRRGHCEYFATALALLARQAGIPARVVGGYRVAEHNPLGNYDIVREKNAHAWVEAWTAEDGWRTFDATPATAATVSHETGALFAVADVVLAAWDRLADAIAHASVWELLGSLAAAVGALALVRWVRARRAARARGPAEVSATPLACFTRLEAELGKRGIRRGPAEVLGQYEARLREARLEDAAELVRSYGALRYGGIGDAAEVSARIDAYVRRQAQVAVVSDRPLA